MATKKRYGKKRTITAPNYPKNTNFAIKKTPPHSKEAQALDTSVKKTDKNIDKMKENLKNSSMNFQSSEMYLQDMIALSFLANALSNLRESFQKDPNDAKKQLIKDYEEAAGDEKFKQPIEAYNKYKELKAELTLIDEKLKTIEDGEVKNQLLLKKQDLESRVELIIKDTVHRIDENGNKVFSKNEQEFINELNKVETKDQKNYRDLTDENIKDDIKKANNKNIDELEKDLEKIKARVLERGADEESISIVTELAEKTTTVITESKKTQSPSLG